MTSTFRNAIPTENLSRSISIFLLTAQLLNAQVSKPDVKKNPISLLPDGSIMQGVLLPRYDAERRLVGDLHAETLTLIDPKRIRGENVLIRFFNADRSLKAKVQLQNALFDSEKSLLRANEAVEVTGDRLIANGSGLVYEFQSGEGFLLGPVSTRISAPSKETSMKTSPLHTAALYAMCLAPTTLLAAPPAFVTEEEIQTIEADATSMKPEIDAANLTASKNLAADEKAGDEATAAALAFVDSANIELTAAPAADSEKAKPLDIKRGPDDTVINCDGGMYFDAEESVLVYMGNVRVTDPRFGLSGANELKIFFEKKDQGDVKAEKDEKDGAGADFGKVQRIIAEGAVVIDQKSVDGKDPVKASGRVLTYNVASGEIIVHGGFPWVQQGAFFARAKEANLTLRLLTDGSFSTQGNWEMGGDLKMKQ
ncbi:MAG: hypothetical protein NWT08_06065 [Akkermansiaceae bacterium]|nr:hypothetical protein [Akkermansiaceae bacterium]MDP4645819.1 hypothetical protein [Akkermansiaceae bacterium]MDP4720554.1 hypothetical protein [Akkermansiaceae bacterium]MDP4779008.1 hypothetical protein [Akkermansiaceae bacterium]MDP4896553.1 hypothetical protein [Akkermansiaceae bacterium]